MCDVDTAVSIIQQYIDEHLFSPSFSWDKYEFKNDLISNGLLMKSVTVSWITLLTTR